MYFIDDSIQFGTTAGVFRTFHSVRDLFNFGATTYLPERYGRLLRSQLTKIQDVLFSRKINNVISEIRFSSELCPVYFTDSIQFGTTAGVFHRFYSVRNLLEAGATTDRRDIS